MLPDQSNVGLSPAGGFEVAMSHSLQFVPASLLNSDLDTCSQSLPTLALKEYCVDRPRHQPKAMHWLAIRTASSDVLLSYALASRAVHGLDANGLLTRNCQGVTSNGYQS